MLHISYYEIPIKLQLAHQRISNFSTIIVRQFTIFSLTETIHQSPNPNKLSIPITCKYLNHLTPQSQTLTIHAPNNGSPAQKQLNAVTSTEYRNGSKSKMAFHCRRTYTKEPHIVKRCFTGDEGAFCSSGAKESSPGGGEGVPPAGPLSPR